MRFSVIVPVYNTQNYLPECIDSVLAQTFGDFELILVDDGSTDDSPQICDDYAARDPRIRVIHQKNAGPAAARNAGLDIAKGDYITFADSDDYVKPQLLQTLSSEFERNDPDCICFQFQQVGEEQEFPPSQSINGFFDLSKDSDRLKMLIQHFFFYETVWELTRIACKRAIIESHHIRLCTSSDSLAEDMGFSFCYLLFCKSYSGIPDVLYNYIRRDDSIMSYYNRSINLNSLNEISAFAYPFFIEAIEDRRLRKQYALCHMLFLRDQYRHVVEEPNYADLAKSAQKVKNKSWYTRQILRFIFNHAYAKQYLSKKDIKRMLIYGAYCLHKKPKLYAVTSYFLYHYLIK